jgi:hypothetical protein
MCSRTPIQRGDDFNANPVARVGCQGLNQLPHGFRSTNIKQQQSPCDLKAHDGQTVLSEYAQVGKNMLDTETGISEEGEQPFDSLDPPR